MADVALTPDQVVQFRAPLTSHAALRATATAGLQFPVIYTLNIAPDTAEEWKLRKRNGENDDDASFIIPADSTTLVWVRVL